MFIIDLQDCAVMKIILYENSRKLSKKLLEEITVESFKKNVFVTVL